MWVKASAEQCKCGCNYVPGDGHPRVPCLFDVDKDMSEYDDITVGNEKVKVGGSEQCSF
jgi:hypothetical protein